ncbi:MAG: hypothetical protein RIC89_16035 [Pseudomonadales bacterium]
MNNKTKNSHRIRKLSDLLRPFVRQNIQPPEFDYDFLMSKLMEDARRLEVSALIHRRPFWFAFIDLCLDSNSLVEWMYHDNRFKALDQYHNKQMFIDFVRREKYFIGCASEIGIACKHAGLHPDKKSKIVQVDSILTEYVTSRPSGFGLKKSKDKLRNQIDLVFEFVDSKPQLSGGGDFARLVTAEFVELEDEFF